MDESYLTEDGRDRRKAWVPWIEPASDEGEKAIAGFKVDRNIKVELVAAEPRLANPVGMAIDRFGRFYIAECFRRVDGGGEDNRDHTYWENDDVAAQSVADRERYVLKHHPEYAEKFQWGSDRVRQLVDSDGDGVVDRDTVFATGFNAIVDGPGTDVLVVDDKVWFTNIPHLWELEDTDGDGIAEKRRSIQNGFGVRYALFGHDLHGLRRGPCGRIYFSIGDRGYNFVSAEGKKFFDPGSGAVFRCEPDGSQLEIFATGLRNPQDLVFDDFGNLITCDNNSDSDDKARVVYVVEGGITGWRMNFQYKPRRGRWVREGWWQTRDKNEGLFLIPPIAHLGHGPSGLEFDRGTGMPVKYRGCFFLCDFLGGTSGSGIRSFRLKENGAGFSFVADDWFLKGTLPADIAFGPDGALYMCDWVATWAGCGKGRIYRLASKEALAEPAAKEAASLLKLDFTTLENERLTNLLAHPNREVRQRAQFALASQGPAGAEIFRQTASQKSLPRLQRLHAIWGLGQLARKSAGHAEFLATLLTDVDAEVAAQAARVLAEARGGKSTLAAIQGALKPSHAPRLQFFAALAAGKLKLAETFDVLCALARNNDDRDLYLRHAVVMGLSGIGDADRLAILAGSESEPLRLVALLSLRRLKDPRVRQFLKDSSERLVVAAARAIYDVPMQSELPTLAALFDAPAMKNPAFARRVIGAADLLSRSEDCAKLAAFAASQDVNEDLRLEALNALYDWAPSHPNDRVLNMHAPRPKRDQADAAKALASHREALFQGKSIKWRKQVARTAGRFGWQRASDALAAWATDKTADLGLRKSALKALFDLESRRFKEVAALCLRSDQARLRAHAAGLLAQAEPKLALPLLVEAIGRGDPAEAAPCIDALAKLKSVGADAAIASWMQKLQAGKVPAAMQLEVLEAAQNRRENPAVAKALADYEGKLNPTDACAPFAPCLKGGDAGRGAKIFRRSELSCERCHALDFGEHAKVGPTLANLGLVRSRSSMLESIVLPQRAITAGYQNIILELKDGNSKVGRYLGEDDQVVSVEISEDDKVVEIVRIAKESIASRRDSGSGMTEGLADKMSRRDLRDLIAFLATQRKKP